MNVVKLLLGMARNEAWRGQPVEVREKNDKSCLPARRASREHVGRFARLQCLLRRTRRGARVNGSRRAQWAPVPNGCTQARHWRRRTVATDRAINRLMPPLRVVEATRMLGRAPATCQAEWRQVGEAKASARRAGPQSAAEAPTERAAELHGLTSALWAAWGGRSGRGLRGFTSQLI